MQGQKEETRVILQLVYHILVLVVDMLVLLLVVFVIIRCCQASYQFCYEIFGSVSAGEIPGEDKVFQVTETDTMYHVAKRLSKEGLIVNSYSFYARTLFMDESELKLRPGSYVLNTSMDYEKIIDKLTTSE